MPVGFRRGLVVWFNDGMFFPLPLEGDVSVGMLALIGSTIRPKQGVDTMCDIDRYGQSLVIVMALNKCFVVRAQAISALSTARPVFDVRLALRRFSVIRCLFAFGRGLCLSLVAGSFLSPEGIVGGSV